MDHSIDRKQTGVAQTEKSNVSLATPASASQHQSIGAAPGTSSDSALSEVEADSSIANGPDNKQHATYLTPP